MGLRIGANFGPLYVSTRLGPRRRRRGSSSPGLLAACVMLTVWTIQAAIWLLVAAGIAIWWLARGIAHLIAERRKAAQETTANRAVVTHPTSLAEPPSAPAGSYTDSQQADRLRYYDGVAWTDHVAIGDSPQSSDTYEGLVTRDAVLPLLSPDVAARITRT